jgi:ubiquinone/menaquinone biosynthesis C-methylase UbiE
MEWHRKSTATTGDPVHQYWEMLGVRNQWAEDLDAAEELILHDLSNKSKNKPILEVGIGGGRITTHLLKITRKYVGIDFSANIVGACKHKFPDADLRLCDARSMSCFDSGSFHVVMLWDQVIDDVQPAERSVILREANRILEGNGILLLASHNLDWSGLAEVNKPSWNEFDLLSIAVYGRTLLSRVWTQITQKGYAVFPEYYPLQNRIIAPTCYIRKEYQEQQLRQTGFTEISVMTRDGEQFTEASRSRDFTLFYTARKG